MGAHHKKIEKNVATGLTQMVDIIRLSLRMDAFAETVLLVALAAACRSRLFEKNGDMNTLASVAERCKAELRPRGVILIFYDTRSGLTMDTA